MKHHTILFLKNLAFTMIVPGTVAVLVPWLIVRQQAVASNAYVAVSLIFFIVGAVIYLWCVWDFASFGRGTPAPIDAPKKLVVRGLYRYTRNPMYVGVLAVILGWAVLFQALGMLIYAMCTALIVHLFIVFYEEPHLRRVFGAEYKRYCSRVRRWLPRFTRRR